MAALLSMQTHGLTRLLSHLALAGDFHGALVDEVVGLLEGDRLPASGCIGGEDGSSSYTSSTTSCL